MADNNLVIPLATDFQKAINFGSKDFEKYLPLLSDNLYTIAGLLSKDQLEAVKKYNSEKKWREADQKDQKEVLKQLKVLNNPSTIKRNNAFLWKQYSSLIGKDINKFASLGKEKLVKLLEEANQTKLSSNLQSKFQKGKELGKGARTAFDSSDFNKYIPLFSKNMDIIADVLTEDQKLKVKFYQQQKESADNQKEIAKILKDSNKPKYQKIKDKLTEKYNDFILKHHWFEKSLDSFKNVGGRAGSWIWDIIKSFLVLSLMDRNGALFKTFIAMMKDLGDRLLEIGKQIAEMIKDAIETHFRKSHPIATYALIGPDWKHVGDVSEEAQKQAQKLLQQSTLTPSALKQKQHNKKFNELVASQIETVKNDFKAKKMGAFALGNETKQDEFDRGVKFLQNIGIKNQKINEILGEKYLEETAQAVERGTQKGNEAAMKNRKLQDVNVNVSYPQDTSKLIKSNSLDMR